jgi:hypothetical protein
VEDERLKPKSDVDVGVEPKISTHLHIHHSTHTTHTTQTHTYNGHSWNYKNMDLFFWPLVGKLHGTLQ